MGLMILNATFYLTRGNNNDKVINLNTSSGLTLGNNEIIRNLEGLHDQ